MKYPIQETFAVHGDYFWIRCPYCNHRVLYDSRRFKWPKESIPAGTRVHLVNCDRCNNHIATIHLAPNSEDINATR